MSMTLEQLKQENETSEQEEIQEHPETEFLNDADESADEQSKESEDLGEGSDEENEGKPVESWMQGEDQDSQDNDQVPLKAHISLRTKLKSQITEQDAEINELKAKVEALSNRTPVQESATAKPKREDFYTEDDPDAAYISALISYERESQNAQAKQAHDADAQTAAIAKAQQKIQEGVEGHYQRAQSFLDEHKINASVYKSADTKFRQAIEAALPEQGDKITDFLLSTIGDGSEKLMMYVGNNEARRQALQASVTNDPSGMAVMRLLGRWETEIEAPKKRTSKAPAPAKSASGNAPAESADAKRLKRKYQEAHKKGHAQAAFDARSEARKAGISIDNW